MNELTKVCIQAGLTSEEWKDQEYITLEEIKKLRNCFFVRGQIVQAWNFNKLLIRKKRGVGN